MKTKTKDELFFKALELGESGNYNESIKLYELILEQNFKYMETLHNLGWNYLQLGMYEKSLNYLNELIGKYPKYHIAYNTLGNVYECQKKYKLAIRNYTKAIELFPEYYLAYNHRGRCFFKTAQLNEALEDYLKSVKLRYDPYNPNELVSIINNKELKKGAVFYEMLKSKGFFPVYTGICKDNFIIMPWLADRLIILPDKIHISETYKRILRKTQNQYTLKFDYNDYDYVFERCKYYYNDPEDITSLQLFKRIFEYINKYCSIAKPVTITLFEGNQPVSGDVGMFLGDEYTSFTGYKDKTNTGKLLLFYIAKYITNEGIKTWDFGPSARRWNSYRIEIGCKKMPTEDYIILQNSVKNISY
jgi:tetratricopeptide (TPR) repeat protein